MKKAIILARVSTKEQEEYGHSLPAQLEKLREYAKRKGFEVIKEFSFSESAGQKIRKKFEEVLHFLKQQKEMPVLLCQNVDRITRNFRDAVDLDDLRINGGLEIHFVQDGFILGNRAGGSEMFMWEAKVFLAKQYINRLTDDAVRSMKHKTDHGEWISKAPLGYLNSEEPETGRSTVILDNERAFLVKRLFLEYATGTVSLCELQRKSKEWGLRTLKGNPISVQTLSNILRNPFYFGMMRIKEELFPHHYPVLIDKSVFNACERIYTKAPDKAVKETSYPFILRGLITCAVSGRKVSCELQKGRYVYLSCRNPANPDKKLWIKEEAILGQIRTAIQSISLPDELMGQIIGHLQASHEVEEVFHQNSIRSLHRESEELAVKLNRLTDFLLDGSITREVYTKKHQEVSQRQHEIGKLLENHHGADDQFKIALSSLIALASKARDLFDSSETEEKRKLIGFIFTNLQMRGEKLEFSMRTPFNLFAQVAGSQEWRPLRDLNPCSHRERVVS